MGNMSIKELERIGKVEDFHSQDSLDVERTFQFVTEENEENSTPDKLPVARESHGKPTEPTTKVRKKEKRRRDSKVKVGSPKNEEKLSQEFLEKEIPRKKKAMQIKLKQLLIELHGKNEILSKGRQILDRLTRERERHLERLEEREQVREGREFVIQSFHEKMQVFSQQIEEKESELREKERLLREANEQAELHQKQHREQEEIVKEMQGTIESLSNKKTSNRQHASRELGAGLESRIELESLRRETDRLKLQVQEKIDTLEERDREIVVLRREKETLQQEKRQSDKFQNRFADKLAWSELSSRQAQEILEMKEEACSAVGASPAHSPKPASPENLEHRRILTPKAGKNARKKLFTEGPISPASKDTTTPSKTTTEDALPRCTAGKSKEQNDAPGGAMLTRSRRRKASQVTNSTPDKPVPTSTEPVKPDILLHHKEMESHITLLDQHSKEQRENLQQHQRLLELERGKLREVEEENDRQLGRMRDLEISFSADKERLLERIRVLESALGEKDQALTQQTVNLTLMNNELEEERVSLRQIQNELEQEREANSVLRKVQSDLVRVTRALDEEKVARNLREQQLREKANNFHGLQATLGEEQQARLRLEEELRQARSACTQLERTLENERLSSQSNLQEVRMKDDTIREQMRLLQQEREAKTSLEDRIRNLQIQVAEESNRRIATERELTEERNTLQQDRENLERERERYEQRIQESERTVNESELRLRELQSAVSAAQDALAEYRRLEPRDWIIRREEVILSQTSLGVGAWGKVFEGTFRSCQVAVKQIHDLILSPHNRRLFEREMSIASRCRHPHLLQFIGATNDDGSPLFVTELLDTDLRSVLIQRPLHHEEIVFIALDVAKGLNYLHLNKPFPIIHRDISSSNVLLWRRDDSWRAKLSDYGAANFMRQYMTSNPGARIHAAPEALTSQQSPKADVYSFGLLLCEMCIRELPVPQQIQEQIGLVTNGVFRELIMRCVMQAPEARPTISDVIAVLAQQTEALRAQGLVTLNGRTATL